MVNNKKLYSIFLVSAAMILMLPNLVGAAQVKQLLKKKV